MSSSPAGPTLTCSQCNFANEVERVYCHNCGAKLDRSLIPKAPEADQKEIDKTRKRVQKMSSPSALNVVLELKTLVKTLAGAALLALIVGIMREPDGVPSVKAKGGELSSLRMIGSELAEAAEAPGASVLQMTEADANSYLRTTLKSKGAALIPGAEFSRAFVRFDVGTVYVGVEQSLFGFPIYSGANYNMGVKGGVFYADNQGGHIGRVRLHPFVMKYASAAFNPLWESLKRERGQIQGMQRIDLVKGGIQLVTKGRGR